MKQSADIAELDEYEQLRQYLEDTMNVGFLPNIEDIEYFIGTELGDSEVLFDYRGEGIKFLLKDRTKCELTYGYNSCILHSHWDRINSNAGEYIYKVDDDLLICATCLTRLQARPEILKQYEAVEDDAEKLLFPKSWTDNGIHGWCRKRQEAYGKRSYRHVVREERESLDSGCFNCVHMRRNECEYGCEEDEGCSLHERR